MKMRWLVLVGLMGVSLACRVTPEASRSPRVRAAAKEVAKKRLVVVSHGWHSGMVVSSKDLEQRAPWLRARFKECLYYEVGWGDEGFYRSGRPGVRELWQAATGSRGSVLHVVACRKPVEQLFPRSEKVVIELSKEGYDRMMLELARAFERGSGGRVLPLGFGLYGDSEFYRAKGSYTMRHNCNAWTAEVLAAGGVEPERVWIPTAGSVMHAVKRVASEDARD